ncbi:hypothetical protein K461DRAFT_70868 [Myriangium duriaei CBS 260.36]|uniref:Uncharacterized protein n=1 Tax=Myriangium duriaei CBS 260.36 TaxID=1168546 RepID=A0A9P4ISV2_9PEZI|nr:hypothetical protein K461DRAFT_70868 [Myriangium duriaei CBS 260.36]
MHALLHRHSFSDKYFCGLLLFLSHPFLCPAYGAQKQPCPRLRTTTRLLSFGAASEAAGVVSAFPSRHQTTPLSTPLPCVLPPIFVYTRPLRIRMPSSVLQLAPRPSVTSVGTTSVPFLPQSHAEEPLPDRGSRTSPLGSTLAAELLPSQTPWRSPVVMSVRPWPTVCTHSV